MNEPTAEQLLAAAEALWLQDAPRAGNEPLPFEQVTGWQRTAYYNKARAVIGAFLSTGTHVEPTA